MPICQQEWMVPVDEESHIYLKEKWQDSTARGPVVLMIHGYNALASLGNYDIPVKDLSGMSFLAARGYDVFALDMRGFGQSSKPQDLTWEDNVADVGVAVSFIREQRRVKRVSLLGGSYGGPITLTYASRYPDLIEHLVLISTPYGEMRPEARAMFDSLVTMAEEDHSTYIAIPLTAQVDKAVVEIEQDFLKWRAEAAQKYGNRVPIGPLKEMQSFAAAKSVVMAVTAPTLLVVGDSDMGISVEDSLKLLKDLGSTEKSLVVIGNAGHSLMYETKHLYFWSIVCHGLPPVGNPLTVERS